MNFEIFNEKRKKEFEEKLKKQFGIKEVSGLLVKKGAERIFLFQGELSKETLRKLEEKIPIERIGIYFAKEVNNYVRLSIDGAQLLKDQINKNIFNLNKEQSEKWIKGEELQIKNKKRDFLIMKYKGDILGTGKASENKISNYLPKNRRLKIKNNRF